MIGYLVGILLVTLGPWFLGFSIGRYIENDSKGVFRPWYDGVAWIILLCGVIYCIAILVMVVVFIGNLVNGLI